ncbi:TolC family outer membrane protein [Breoghania sp. L-A4]|uniref:TolC family outer membrane protein n=1 Tax=Breoghania sp. L-A4 TaxID=2304600 RepID=UPI0013C2F93F|nr:TolC family outer membrane protein [Breoghania sp. L-A4]
MPAPFRAAAATAATHPRPARVAILLVIPIVGAVFASPLPAFAAGMTLQAAVERAVTTNPRILEAAANRRAVDHELGEAYGLYLPTLDIEAGIGPQFVDNPNSLSTANNRDWRLNRDVSLVARQTLFDGFSRANEVYRQAARIDSAAARVIERSELVALEAVETFLDVLRHRRILAAADGNIRRHNGLLSRVRTRVEGGSSTEGELRQAEERLAATQAVRADILKALGTAEARFENVIGMPPGGLRGPGMPRGMPATQAAAILTARASHPALNAGGADVDAAMADRDKAGAAFLPTVGLEGRATFGEDLDGTPGRNNDLSVRLTMSWNIFNGGIDRHRQLRQNEKLTESQMRLDQLRRSVDETVRRAWSDIRTNDLRQAALMRQSRAANAVIATYDREFDAGLRDLLDLLDAQNSNFNVQVQLISAQTIAVFSRYRLFAATGHLLSSFNVAPPAEGTPGPRETPWFVGSRPLIEPLRKW